MISIQNKEFLPIKKKKTDKQKNEPHPEMKGKL